MEKLESVEQRHLNGDEFASVSGTCQQNSWPLLICLLTPELPTHVLLPLFTTHFLTQINKTVFIVVTSNFIRILSRRRSQILLIDLRVLNIEFLRQFLRLLHVLLHEFKSINLNHINIPVLPRLANALHGNNLWIVHRHRLDQVSRLRQEKVRCIVPRKQLRKQLLIKCILGFKNLLDLNFTES